MVGSRWCLVQGKPEFLVPGNQETTRPTGNSGKRKEITRKITLIQQETWYTFVCDAPVSHKRRKKSPIFFLLIFFLEIPRKNLVFDLFTVKLCKNPVKDFCWWDLGGVCSLLSLSLSCSGRWLVGPSRTINMLFYLTRPQLALLKSLPCSDR